MTEDEKSSGSDPRGLLGMLLRPFGEVRANEVASALTLSATIFLLLAGYYLLKVVREPLVLQEGGAEVKSYASAAQVVVIAFVVRGLDLLARRASRIQLVSTVNLVSIACLLAFAAALKAGLHIGVVFFVWVGIFNLTATAQFWGLANDLYTPEQGKRLFAIVGIGSSVGAVAGARAAGPLYAKLGAIGLMLGAAILVAACTAMMFYVDRRDRTTEAGDARAVDARKPIGGPGALKLLFADRYLMLIATLLLVLNWVNKTGEYLLDRTLLDVLGHGNTSALVGKQIAAFKSNYFTWVNIIGVVLQLFVASRVLKYLGVRGALFVLPTIALVGYSLLLVYPMLAAVRVAKIAENSVDYSIQSTSQQALYLVTSRSAKYTTKTFIDAFVVRFGDVCSAAAIFVGHALHFSTKGFVAVNVALVGVWLATVVAIGREHARREQSLTEPSAAEPSLGGAVAATT